MTPAEIVKEHPILLEDLMQFCKNEMGAKLTYAVNADGVKFGRPLPVASLPLHSMLIRAKRAPCPN